MKYGRVSLAVIIFCCIFTAVVEREGKSRRFR